MDNALKRKLISAQRDEITEYHVYSELARREKEPANRSIFETIAADELRHYNFWAECTNEKVAPNKFKIFKFKLLARFPGTTFAVKLMEGREQSAQPDYDKITAEIPNSRQILLDELEHERKLTRMLEEEKMLKYSGSIVLGLNDALVELTGALAGFTLALQKGNLIAASGLIMGIAAALSMAASEYLSRKAEPDNDKAPFRAAVYTGIAYIVTVGILITPFFILAPFPALACTLGCVLLIILAFTYYISIARDLPFKKRFLEMAALSLSVAAFSFLVGYLVRIFLGVDI